MGVISPYQQQVRTLKEYFSRRFGSKIIESVDFNSVDGFQGQEKDIIIFSCVRASASGTVGFLADVRRMNVALTRARQSLFILGHADTLRRESIWGDLVQDAESRGLFTKVLDRTRDILRIRAVGNEPSTNMILFGIFNE